jgi:pyruvate formate lyase activating enzyme
LSNPKIEQFDQRIVCEALLQEKKESCIQCGTCWKECCIKDGSTGFCKTRINQNGKLFTLSYGNISSLSNNPIEKKPLFHFYPGSQALTVGGWGCNATCGFCQNYDISKTPPSPTNAQYMSPEEFVMKAKNLGSEGTSVSLNEAATLMLEWNIKMFSIAKKNGLYNTIVTNGYMTTQALDLMINAGLDAANVDVKGCEQGVKRECGIDVHHVWDNLVHMKKRGIHVEITTLVVPGLSDDMNCLQSIAERIKADLGEKIPWHVNRYHPAYKYTAPATPLDVLLKARSIAKDIGLCFVYIGNVWKRGLEDTFCPSCGKKCYERFGFGSRNTGTDEFGNCRACGEDLFIRIK